VKYRLRFGQESEAKKWRDKLYEVTIRVHAESGGLTAAVPGQGPPPAPSPRRKTLPSDPQTRLQHEQQPGSLANGEDSGGLPSSPSQQQQQQQAGDSTDYQATKTPTPTTTKTTAATGDGSSGGGSGGGGGRRRHETSWGGYLFERAWLAFSVFSFGAGCVASLPAPTLDFWFFKVFVVGGVLHGTAVSLLALCCLASFLAAHFAATPSSSSSSPRNHHRRHRSGSSGGGGGGKARLYAASGVCFLAGLALVVLPAVANLPLAKALPARVEVFLAASGFATTTTTSTTTSTTTTQGAQGAQEAATEKAPASASASSSASASAFGWGEYLVDPPCALANVWEYYPHTHEIVYKTHAPAPTLHKSSGGGSGGGGGGRVIPDWSGFGGLSNRNDSATELRLAVFGRGASSSDFTPGDDAINSGGEKEVGEDVMNCSSSSVNGGSEDACDASPTTATTTTTPTATGTGTSTGNGANAAKKKKKQQKKASLKPVVLSFHGGGWYRGSLYDGLQCYLPAALDTGTAVVAAEYRSGAGGWTGKDMVADALEAIKWVQSPKGGGRHGLDPSKVVVMGGGAGAHVGLVAAYLHNKRLKGTWLSIRGVVARYGAIGDLTQALRSPSYLPRSLRELASSSSLPSSQAHPFGGSGSGKGNAEGAEGAAAAAAAAAVASGVGLGWSEKLALEHIAGKESGGGGEGLGVDQMAELSWLSVPTHVSAWTPPTIVLHCMQDEFYDLETHAHGLASALSAAGRPHLFITPKLHSHGCDIGSTAPFQFLRFALTELLQALKNEKGN